MQGSEFYRERIHDSLVEIMELSGVPIDMAAKIRDSYDRRNYSKTIEMLSEAVGECQDRESSDRLNYIADMINIAQRHNGI